MTVFPVIVFFGIGWIMVQRFALAASAGVELARAGPADMNEGTRCQVASFAELGYRELAVYEARFSGGKFSLVVMAGPGGTAWAEVTDRLWEVASTFGPRLLRTVTRSMLPPGPTLVQCVRSAPPRIIVAEHERALALLAERGLSPDRLEDHEILARFESETRAAQALLRRSMARTALELAWRRPLARHHGRPALAADPRAGTRIDAWLGTR
ncbi:MAG TPA: hypothetical protein VJP59_01915 [Gemmatimonadota bacterium]|nr:hypothetical protein [Gemmatimonadota bacterium]